MLADDWNKLGNEIIKAKTVNGFKARYDKLIILNNKISKRSLGTFDIS